MNRFWKKKKHRTALFFTGLFLLSVMAVLITACSGKKEDAGSGVKYVGFDLDLAQEVADRNGWTLVRQPVDWDSKDNELSTGAIDCIWNGFTINGREDKYTWSKAYLNNSQVIVVKKDSDVRHPKDLAGKLVEVQADSSALAAFTGEDATPENKALAATFQKTSQGHLQQVADYNTAFLNLESGSVDAIVMDSGVAGYQIKRRGDKFRMLTGDENVISREQYGIGFRLGNTALRDAVQKTLDEMQEDGTVKKIADRWGQTESVCIGESGTDAAYQRDAGQKASAEDEEALKNKTQLIVGFDASFPPYGFKEEAKQKSSGMANFWRTTKELSSGMLASLLIFVLTLIFSLPLGLLLNSIRMSRVKVLQWLARIYISIMRGTPLMLQLLVVFFGPYYIFGIEVSNSFRFTAVIIGFSLNYAAYFAEIFRAGLEGIPAGQTEAAIILGYTRTQRYWRILFPQMVKRVLPPVTNEVITLVKDTSLAFALSYAEMFTIAKQTAAADASIAPLFVAGLFYYVFNFLVAMMMEKIEKSLKFSV